MSISSTGLSKSERKRLRGHHGHRPKRAAKAPDPSSLLYTRAQTARLLNCSVATVIRMENSGVLDALKLNPESPSAMTYHRAEQVRVLAGGDR